MRLSDASVVIRPRPTWEAMDLGVLLSQRHRRLLMTSWAIVTLPLFTLLTLLLWDSPSLAVFIFWWLKPAYERLPLYILSKALFGETPSFKQALREWPRLLKPQLLASLTWQRPGLSRSFVMPVMQLEGLSGPARQQRLTVLKQQHTGARWLTLLGLHLEVVLWFGLMTLFYLLLPHQVEVERDWQRLLFSARNDWLWLEHLTNSFYVLVLIFWEPIYVACGFSLYLNRRTVLEAWDIELVFRRLSQRLRPVAALLLIAASLTFWPAPQTVQAAPAPLSHQAARTAINDIVEKPPFKNQETVTRYRFAEEARAAKEKDPKKPAASLPAWLKSLLERLDSSTLKQVAHGIQILLWSLVIGAIALVIWRYRAWLKTFVNDRRPAKTKAPGAVPEQMFGLKLGVETLPEDIAASAERLWSEHPRQALGLLYRGLLSRLLHDFKLPLKNADTEGQVLQRIAQLHAPELLAFSTELTRHWQNLAYGHQVPAPHLQTRLCDTWRTLFGPEDSR